MVDLNEYVSRIAKLVDSVMLNEVRSEHRGLAESSLHYVRAGGKRLRPTVVFLVGEGLGCTNERALSYAAASVEALHTYTLIHDDIMDRDTVRRGVPTVHVLWGEPMAILAGDFLFAYSLNLLLQSADLGFSVDQVYRMACELVRASIALAEGQAMDMDFEKRTSVSIEEYMVMIEKKTAALFQACGAIGAIAARASYSTIERIKIAMKYAGIAFQIIDDVLGITVDTSKLGKPKYSDIREGKKTLPMIIAMDRARPTEADELVRILSSRSKSEHDIERAAEIIERSGAIEECRRMARDYADRALRIIEEVNFVDPEKKNLLKELIDFIVRRGY